MDPGGVGGGACGGGPSIHTHALAHFAPLSLFSVPSATAGYSLLKRRRRRRGGGGRLEIERGGFSFRQHKRRRLSSSSSSSGADDTTLADSPSSSPSSSVQAEPEREFLVCVVCVFCCAFLRVYLRRGEYFYSTIDFFWRSACTRCSIRGAFFVDTFPVFVLFFSCSDIGVRLMYGI